MEDIRKLIGRRIKEIRLVRGLSQEKLSNIAELDRTYVASVENGKRNVSIINIQKTCRALDMTLKDFFDCDLF